MVVTALQNLFDDYENWFRNSFVNYNNPNSLATKLRKQRAALFNSLMQSLAASSSLRILDVGGRQNYWEMVDFYKDGSERIEEIAVMNLEYDVETTDPRFRAVVGDNPKFKAVIGDARDMKRYQDKEFDVVFSNSVIEHVGSYEDQRRMADEVRRVGKRYFIQTPNLYFPIEPHFLIPLLQFYPTWLKVFILRKKIEDKQKLTEFVSHIKLLTKKQMIDLFPGATIYEEKFLGITKSFVAYDGW